MLSYSLLECGFVGSCTKYSLFTYNRDGKFMAYWFMWMTWFSPVMIRLPVQHSRRICIVVSVSRIWDPLKYFIGIELTRSSKGLFLSQHKYALEIIEECDLLGAKPVNSPMETNHKLGFATGPVLDDPTHYRWLVGRLLYLTLERRELTYSIHILSQFMQQPKEVHMAAARCVLRYLKGNPG